jgi:hypothetical protein
MKVLRMIKGVTDRDREALERRGSDVKVVERSQTYFIREVRRNIVKKRPAD